MSNKSPLTVEIFRDADRPNVSLEGAESGIEFISDYLINRLAIAGMTRTIQYEQQLRGINPARFEWPGFTANLNVVVTDRSINVQPSAFEVELAAKYPSKEVITKGVSLVMQPGSTTAPRYAVVDVFNDDGQTAARVVAHEIAHLLGIKNRGVTWDNESHCTDDDCLQYPVMTQKDYPEGIPSRGLKNLAERMRLIEKQTEPVQTCNDTFCKECAHQLEGNAFFLGRAAAGKFTPRQWIP